jgi:S1-C subfamily serine protease
MATYEKGRLGGNMRRVVQTLLTLAFAATLEAQPRRLPDEENTISVFKRAQLAVVHINVSVQQSGAHGDRVSGEGLASGFLIDRQGRILTNYHVVEKSNHVEVYLPGGRRTVARLLGTAPSLDLALLQVDLEKSDGVAPLPLGDSDALEVGQKVIALGNPLALHNTLTVGVLSALDRTFPGAPAELEGSLIQTDAAINPGNSGGPLLDSSGNVIGIAEARVSAGENLSFAIPINLAKQVLGDLEEMGHPYRPPLGMSGIEITPQLAELFRLPVGHGFLIQNVSPGSPADMAGLLSGTRTIALGEEIFVIGGDVLIAIDGREISTRSQIQKAFLEARPGQRMTLTVFRNGRTLDLELLVEPMHAPWR